jgi:hypothetical protein
MPLRLILSAALGVIAIAAIAAVAAILLLGGDDDGDSRPSNGRYTNATMRYSFEYPRGWQDLTDQIPFVVPEATTILDRVAVGTYETETGAFNGIQVSVVQVNHTVDDSNLRTELEALDQVYSQQAATVRGKLHPPEWVELGGLTARQYVTEFAFGSSSVPIFQVASAQVVTFFGDRQYIVNCQGRLASFDEQVLPGCEQALQAFRFR